MLPLSINLNHKWLSIMKNLFAAFAMLMVMSFTSVTIVSAQTSSSPAPTATAVASADTLSDDALKDTGVADTSKVQSLQQPTGFHQSLKRKFIEGNAGFMSLVALALVLGLAFCIE